MKKGKSCVSKYDGITIFISVDSYNDFHFTLE